MARLVLGIGTSHSPQVSTGPDVWSLHAERDRANVAIPFERLARSAPAWMPEQLAPDVWQRKYDTCQAAVARLGDILAEQAPDFLVVVGDDQRELFAETSVAALAVYSGEELWDLPEDRAALRPSIRPAAWARHAEHAEAYPIRTDFADFLTGSLTEQGFDPMRLAAQPEGRSAGHAFTFVRLRLMTADRKIPIVPVMVNAIYPPNQPTAARCVALGHALRSAIEAWPVDARVGLVASGGLSHFVVDEALDHSVLRALETHDDAALCAIPSASLVSGSGEIRNWLAVGAAVRDLSMKFVEYVPGYRSEAGTGCGMAFAAWTA
jgi:3-O-methylgallate 3,4-dioxygenase